MASVDDLYQQIILDHNKHPRNFGVLKEATHSASGNNPLCGDETVVRLRIEDGVIKDVRFSGQGCAISLASASMMTEAIMGKTIGEIQQLSAHILGSLRGDGDVVPTTVGDLASLGGVRKFPARLKCATLPWHALLAALDGRQSVSTESDDLI